MATFLSSALLLGALAQAPVPSPESLAVFSARIARDSGDGRAWFALGRLELRATTLYHRHLGPPPPDTMWVRGTIARAESAFTHAALLRAGSAEGDSARAYRIFAWAELGVVAWELGDTAAVTGVWAARPPDAQLPPVLEELAENFLRACPMRAVLLTESDAVASAAWYLRYARGIRPDVTTIPLARYQSDSLLAERVNRDLRLVHPARSGTREDRVRALVGERPVCVGADFAAPPGGHGHITWRTRPLVWVAGKSALNDKVPAADFVFAALKLALDANDPWGRSAREIYRRAAKLSPSLCPVLATYGVRGEKVGCK